MNLPIKLAALVIVLLVSSNLNYAGKKHTQSKTTYKTSAPIKYTNKNNIILENLSIDCNNEKIAGMQLHYCSNVHIKNCKIYNADFYGIKLYNCTNVTIENCFITNVQAGVYAQQSKTIRVINNQFLNMNGPFPS